MSPLLLLLLLASCVLVTHANGTDPHSHSEDHSHDHKHDHHHRHADDDEGGSPATSPHQHQPAAKANRQVTWKVWCYSVGAVCAVSVCGLLSVVLVPLIQRCFFRTLLQFLVGMAVGSLSADALLHLMPHAILDGGLAGGEEDLEVRAIWRGVCALCGVLLFFVAERVLGAVAVRRRQQAEQKQLEIDEKTRYDPLKQKDEKETVQMLESGGHEVGFHGRSSLTAEEGNHHGAHGHSHSEVPRSASAVAWMVILGDGLHNFCDGLAIGAAFASGDADGISTSVAVFCHELPHELGDFAMLLKTGMGVREAVFYNCLSSGLCLLGMCVGVSLGNVHSATDWVFAATAGIFLYIALVDMMPELVLPENGGYRDALSTLAVQVIGILIGLSVMLLIALHEHHIHNALDTATSS